MLDFIRMRRVPAGLAALLMLLTALPAWAVKEWYDYYHDARNRMQAERWEDALASLKAAVRLKPDSGLAERTYGMNFEAYLPYYRQGTCYLRLKEFNKAVEMFNLEERQGAITRNPGLYQDLKRLRKEAQDGENQRIARLLRDEVRRLVREASDLNRAGKFDDALARLAEAQKAAESLDPATQREILEMKDKIRADRTAQAQAEARAQRIETALGEGRRLLEAGQNAEAIAQFDVVLSLDATNSGAREGKREAQERIRATRTRQHLEARFQEGKSLFEAGQYEQAIPALTEAAADPRSVAARKLLEKAQQTVERMRQQKELRKRIDGLLADGESLLAARKYPDAQVQFESVLALDPGNVRARDRLAFAERMIGEMIMDRWLPQSPPVLNVLEPRATRVSILGPTVAVVGSATDERSIDHIEFRLGGRLVGEVAPAPRLDGGESLRNVRFDRVLPLTEGDNTITVTAWDGSGLKDEETFRVTRELRFYETRAFLPSALAGAVGLIGLGFALQRVRRAQALRSRFNPYIAGAPVLDDGMFFGREKLLARMMNVLHHNSLMITGERRIGKTTFLYHLKKALEKDDATDYRFFPVFTDLQGVPEAAFFHAVMSDVVDALDLSPATVSALRFRPETEAYDGRDFSHDLQQVIAELKTRTTKRVKLALLIDEVDVLNEYSDRINQRLRSIFMKTFSEHLVAIMSGVGIRRNWKSEGSPWYNFFDEVELTGFSREEAEALIRTPVQGYFRYSVAAVETILAESGMKPYLIQKLCIHAVNRMLEDGRTRVSEEDVAAARATLRLEADEGGPLPLARQASA